MFAANETRQARMREAGVDLGLALRWIEALESGEYQQGKEMLRQTLLRNTASARDVYCCLGVACHVADPKGWTFSVAIDGWRFGSNGAYLPDDIAARLGLTGSGGMLRDLLPGQSMLWKERTAATSGYGSLLTANDGYDVPFPRIAAMLREYYGFASKEVADASLAEPV